MAFSNDASRVSPQIRYTHASRLSGESGSVGCHDVHCPSRSGKFPAKRARSSRIIAAMGSARRTLPFLALTAARCGRGRSYAFGRVS